MFHSAEIRWFLPVDGDEVVERWMKPDASAEEPARTDSYLILPGCTTVGVKIRSGNFEVKARTRAPELVDYGNTVSGYRDGWVKWSTPAAGIADLASLMSEGERWALVEKRRTVRKVSTDGAPLPAGDWPDSGCQVEETDLRVLIRSHADGPLQPDDWSAAGEWRTIGLEAFGQPGDELGILDAVAPRVFAGTDVRLDAETSMSYPVWLDRLHRHDG